MSGYYNSQRTRNLYDSSSDEPFRISRSKIELFIECPRCFYLDRRLGTGRPPGFPYNLNSAVDQLLKNEFDAYRKSGEQHPLLKSYNIDAFPVNHEELQDWRNNFKGIQYLHRPTNLLVFGAIDDLWQNSRGDYLIVDYKSTSKNERITELNKPWQISYKRQMEIYQWLLRMKGYQVSDTGYFVYCNGDRSRNDFNARLHFDITLIPYTGDCGWVEKSIYDLHACLCRDEVPQRSDKCDYCSYVETVTDAVNHAGE